MGDKENSLELILVRIKCGEPCLAQTGSEHHQARGVAIPPSLLECSQSSLLNRVRFGRLLPLFFRRRKNPLRRGFLGIFLSTGIFFDPRRIEGIGGVAEEEILE